MPSALKTRTHRAQGKRSAIRLPSKTLRNIPHLQSNKDLIQNKYVKKKAPKKY
jgi:hypothetical protein